MGRNTHNKQKAVGQLQAYTSLFGPIPSLRVIYSRKERFRDRLFKGCFALKALTTAAGSEVGKRPLTTVTMGVGIGRVEQGCSHGILFHTHGYSRGCVRDIDHLLVHCKVC